MEPGNLLRIIIILSGGILLCVTLFSLAKRRMTETFCLAWGFVSVIIVLAGILLRPTEWVRYISGMGMILVGIVAFCVVYGAYFISIRVSDLTRRNLELAMQVSLLREENEEIREEIREEIKEEMQESFEGKGQYADVDMDMNRYIDVDIDTEMQFHEKNTLRD